MNREKVLILLSMLSALEAVPSVEKELSFKTTLADYPMAYSSASFAISNDVIYVVNGANVGNYVLKFDLNGTFLEQYPGWYNFPHDIIVGGQYKDQVLVSALGVADDSGLLRFGIVLYDSQGEYLHGLHQADSGLLRPWGLGQGSSQGAGEGDKVLVTDWQGNKTYLVNFDWSNGTVQSRQEIAGVPFPTNFAMSEHNLVILSLVCCQLDEFIKMSIFDFHGNLETELSHLPSGEKILNPADVVFDPSGNIILSDLDLGVRVLSPDASKEVAKLPLEGSPPHKMMFYKDRFYALTSEETGENEADSFITVYKYTA